MEKDIDEVGKVARLVKSKIEEIDREVRPFASKEVAYLLTSYSGLDWSLI